MPLLGSDRGEPSASALGTPASHIRSCTCSSNLIDFLEGVDFFVLHLHRSYGGGTQRSRPPQMSNQCLSLTQYGWIQPAKRQIGLRSKQRQDIADDRQPPEQVLGMLLIISDPCRCLDPTEGTSASQKSCSQLLPVCTTNDGCEVYSCLSYIDPPVRVTPSG